MTWQSVDRFARGHKRQPERHGRLTPYRAEHDVPKSGRRGISLRKYEGVCFNQNRVGSCGPHAYAKGVKIGLAAAGTPLPFEDISPRIWYALCRLVQAPGEPLQDVGSYPSALQQSGAQWGVCAMGPAVAEGYSDCNQDNCNENPDLGELVQAAQRLVVGEYSLSGEDEFIACLEAGRPFPLSVPGGSDAWQGYEGSEAIGPVPLEQAELDHEVLCVGYRVAADGSIEWEILNSWDESYGDAGHIWINEAAMAQCADQTAMKVSLA